VETASTLQSALDTAAEGSTIYLAPGEHVFLSPITVPKNVTLSGDPEKWSIMRFPTSPTTTDVFGILPSVGGCSITRVVIEGPAQSTNAGKFAYAVYVAGIPAAASAVISLNAVAITRSDSTIATNGWYRGVHAVAGASTDTGALKITIDNSSISTANGALNVYSNPSQQNREVIVRNSTLHDTSSSHLAYVHSNVSFFFEDTVFDAPGSSSYALQHFTASGVLPARYAGFRRCKFLRPQLGVLTSDIDSVTTFDDCFYESAQPSAAIVTARNSVTFNGGTVRLSGSAIGFAGTDSGVMTIAGTRFTHIGGGACVNAVGSATTIANASFHLHPVGSLVPRGVRVQNATTPVVATVRGCTFTGGRENTQNSAGIAVQCLLNGTVTVKDCSFDGVFNPPAAAVTVAGDSTLVVDGSRFSLSTTSRPAHRSGAGSITIDPSNTIIGGIPSVL